ncbi:hypothetical protein CDD81_985 [Ophiocordyceps australis]|uniref:TauD/TfdA-like domain-containing protein n=1 Tax=Ophiocordyceps australis TaxID=1399860 RepID=A0A2C5Y0Q3_9HYPO|nr:hypothetical protein CDD81_985 [Ophiocordyceps australis]
MRSEYDADPTMHLVQQDGRPSYYCQTSELLSWGEAQGGISYQPIYPTGWLLQPAKQGALGMPDVDAAKVRALAQINSPVVLRGFFAKPNQDVFVAKAHEFGQPLPWKFGLLLKVKDQGTDSRGLNNVLSSEWMPFHYDGLFKTSQQLDPTGHPILVSTPPRFQFFTAPTPSPKNTGFTLFSSSTQFFRHLPPWLSKDLLADKTWSVCTSSFNSTQLSGLPLITPHPATGQACLRYHEPWPQSKTQFDATSVTIDGLSESESRAICQAIDAVLHDRRVAYYHSWEKGDVLVNDNVLMMHTRSDFTAGSDRELWRIHFD